MHCLDITIFYQTIAVSQVAADAIVLSVVKLVNINAVIAMSSVHVLRFVMRFSNDSMSGTVDRASGGVMCTLRMRHSLKFVIFAFPIDNKRTELLPFQKGLIMSAAALLGLFDEVTGPRFGLDYVLTSRLNQDFVENFFSQVIVNHDFDKDG